jgi:hypothetical protein
VAPMEDEEVPAFVRKYFDVRLPDAPAGLVPPGPGPVGPICLVSTRLRSTAPSWGLKWRIRPRGRAESRSDF